MILVVTGTVLALCTIVCVFLAASLFVVRKFRRCGVCPRSQPAVIFLVLRSYCFLFIRGASGFSYLEDKITSAAKSRSNHNQIAKIAPPALSCYNRWGTKITVSCKNRVWRTSGRQVHEIPESPLYYTHHHTHVVCRPPLQRVCTARRQKCIENLHLPPTPITNLKTTRGASPTSPVNSRA